MTKEESTSIHWVSDITVVNKFWSDAIIAESKLDIMLNLMSLLLNMSLVEHISSAIRWSLFPSKTIPKI